MMLDFRIEVPDTLEILNQIQLLYLLEESYPNRIGTPIRRLLEFVNTILHQLIRNQL